MNTRTRQAPSYHERPFGDALDDLPLSEQEARDLAYLESLSDDDLEALLFDEEEKSQDGLFNLPTVAGLSLILVGVAYFLQELGVWTGFDLGTIAAMLPWLAGVLIILLGFGVLSWRPKRKKKAKKAKRVEVPLGKAKVVVEPKDEKKRLRRSRENKIAGVCGGIAEYFNLDPTLVRIAFVIATIASGGNFIFAYLAAWFIMPEPRKPTLEERVTIIRDV